jgi:hypothetical protein
VARREGEAVEVELRAVDAEGEREEVAAGDDDGEREATRVFDPGGVEDELLASTASGGRAATSAARFR